MTNPSKNLSQSQQSIDKNEVSYPFRTKSGASERGIYSDLWSFLNIKGKQFHGSQFHLYEEDQLIIFKLLAWAIRDRKAADHLGIDLNKGILLTGPVGCGKTTLMHVIRLVMPPEYQHRLKSCREIAHEFAEEGFSVITRYTKCSFYPIINQPMSLCLDDLGLESVVQYYGNESNTIAEILLSRYDYYKSHKMLTHITTNLSANEIQTRYGARVRSRMRELFNLIAFSSNSTDKRK